MAYSNQRRRVRISGVGQDSEEGSDNSRSEEIIPSLRTESFRDIKAESGLQRQFSSEMSHTDYDSSYEGEFASAIAAAAFAIYSAEESNSESYQNKKLRDATEIIPISRVRTTMQDQFKPPESSQISNSTRFSGWEARDAASMRIRMDQSEMGVSTSRGSSQAKANAWEKAAMAKIEKRYVKMNSAILDWENEKKMKAKLQMESKKSEMELRSALNLQHYKNKLARIDHSAIGARVQMEENREIAESEVKERANRIRSTGTAPVTCFCF